MNEDLHIVIDGSGDRESPEGLVGVCRKFPDLDYGNVLYLQPMDWVWDAIVKWSHHRNN